MPYTAIRFKPFPAVGVPFVSDDIKSGDGPTPFMMRLREAVKREAKASDFAEKAGISPNSLNKYLAGMQATAPVLVKLADAAGWSVDYLLGRSNVRTEASLGRDDTNLITNVFNLKPGDPIVGRYLGRTTETAVPEGFVAVPFLDVRASAGPGRASLPAELVAQAHFLFSEAWLSSLGVAGPNAELLQAEGDSMYPTIQDGDLMLVDRGYGEVVHGKIYALVVNGLVVVKRVNFLAFGGLMLISDNDRYPTETVRREDVADLSFQGRVAWYGRAI